MDNELIPTDSGAIGAHGSKSFSTIIDPLASKRPKWGTQWNMDTGRQMFVDKDSGDERKEMYVRILGCKSQMLLFRGGDSDNATEVLCLSEVKQTADGPTLYGSGLMEGRLCHQCPKIGGWNGKQMFEQYRTSDELWEGGCSERLQIFWDKEYIKLPDGSFQEKEMDQKAMMSLAGTASNDLLKFQKGPEGKSVKSYVNQLKDRGYRELFHVVTRISIEPSTNAKGQTYVYQHFSFAFEVPDYKKAEDNKVMAAHIGHKQEVSDKKARLFEQFNKLPDNAKTMIVNSVGAKSLEEVTDMATFEAKMNSMMEIMGIPVPSAPPAPAQPAPVSVAPAPAPKPATMSNIPVPPPVTAQPKIIPAKSASDQDVKAKVVELFATLTKQEQKLCLAMCKNASSIELVLPQEALHTISSIIKTRENSAVSQVGKDPFVG